MVWEWTNGWLWLSAALVIGVIEVLAPGWIFLGIAIAVGVMGLVILAGAWPWGFAGALVATGLLSLVAWLALRRAVGVQHGQIRIWDRDINDN